jgi:hypothetical protein
MIARSRRTLVVTAVCAAAITGLSVVGNLVVVRHPSPGLRPAIFAALLSLPGGLLTGVLGMGHGPDGFPTQNDIVAYVFTFLLWWGSLYLSGRWWVRRGATNS